jgi:hypothetical protein
MAAQQTKAGSPKKSKAGKTSAGKGKKSAGGAGGKARATSSYNIYMKEALANLKTDKANANKSHKELFKMAAESWKNSPKNPNRGK